MSETNCDKCGKGFKEHETVYCLEVIESVFPDLKTGGVEVDKYFVSIAIFF